MVIVDSNDAIAQIKERVDVVELFGTQVTLKRRGARWLGLCPFHSEKTPSFSVNVEMGVYYCFGCKAKGDIFSFVMGTQGFTFGQALETLADRTGVTLPERRSGPSTTQAARQVMDLAARTYAETLLGSKTSMPARRYLKEREIDRDAATSWALGYAAPGVLLAALNPDQVQVAEQLGILRQGREFLAGRLILPVRDSVGRTVGLAGRVIQGTSPAKYMNTDASQLWSRNQVLYGLDLASPHIRKKGFAILVEGQIDTISMHTGGWDNTVAPCGSAVSHQHIAHLAALAKRLVVLGDGDEAGLTMAMHAWEHAVGTGLVVLSARLPAGMDPDRLVRSNPEQIQTLIDQAVSPVTASLQKLRDQLAGTGDPEQQAALVRQGIQFITGLTDPLVRARLAQSWAGEWSIQVPLGSFGPASIQFEWSLDRQALAMALQEDHAINLGPWLLQDPICQQALAYLQRRPDGTPIVTVTPDNDTPPELLDLLAAVACADPEDTTIDLDGMRWHLVARAGRVALQQAALQGDAERASTLAKLLRTGRKALDQIEQLIHPEGLAVPAVSISDQPAAPSGQLDSELVTVDSAPEPSW